MSDKPILRSDSMRNFFWAVLIIAFVVVLSWNFVQVGGDKKALPGAEFRDLRASFQSEAEQLRSRKDLYDAKLEDKRAEQNYGNQNRSLDFGAGFLAKQQKEQDLRDADRIIAFMKSDLPEAQKGQQRLDAVLTSEEGMIIARDDRLVRLFEYLHNERRLRPEDILFEIKQAEELRDEMLKEDAGTRAETRIQEIAKLGVWGADCGSSKVFYEKAQMQIEAMVQEAQSVAPPEGPRLTLAKAMERVDKRTIRDRMFQQQVAAAQPATQAE